jgi:hypothetical protein
MTTYYAIFNEAGKRISGAFPSIVGAEMAAVLLPMRTSVKPVEEPCPTLSQKINALCPDISPIGIGHGVNCPCLDCMIQHHGGPPVHYCPDCDCYPCVCDPTPEDDDSADLSSDRDPQRESNGRW